MKVDFYQLSRDPVDVVVPMLAGKVLGQQAKLLVVAQDTALREALSEALWARGGAQFLANAPSGDPHAARNPILISDTAKAENDAQFVLFADGEWHDDALSFERALLLFDEDATPRARTLWKDLSAREDVECAFHKQGSDGRWARGG